MDAPRAVARRCRRASQRALPARVPQVLRSTPPVVEWGHPAPARGAIMIRVSAGALALCAALFATVDAQQTPPAAGPTLAPLWTLTTGFASPESAYYDAGSNTV